MLECEDWTFVYTNVSKREKSDKYVSKILTRLTLTFACSVPNFNFFDRKAMLFILQAHIALGLCKCLQRFLCVVSLSYVELQTESCHTVYHS